MSSTDYAKAVNQTLASVESGQHSKPIKPMEALNLSDLDSMVAEAQRLMAALPPAALKPRRKPCHGLPRRYPKMWMGRPHSNSLMYEFKELQRIPSNGLKSLKD